MEGPWMVYGIISIMLVIISVLLLLDSYARRHEKHRSKH